VAIEDFVKDLLSTFAIFFSQGRKNKVELVNKWRYVGHVHTARGLVLELYV
jgi:hypothetical protein